jgi:hypothetical protein
VVRRPLHLELEPPFPQPHAARGNRRLRRRGASPVRSSGDRGSQERRDRTMGACAPARVPGSRFSRRGARSQGGRAPADARPLEVHGSVRFLSPMQLRNSYGGAVPEMGRSPGLATHARAKLGKSWTIESCSDGVSFPVIPTFGIRDRASTRIGVRESEVHFRKSENDSVTRRTSAGFGGCEPAYISFGPAPL